MMRLLRAEAARILSRRFTVVALLVLLVGLVLFQIEVYRASRPPSAAEVAANRAQYEYSHQEWREDHREYVQRCVEGGQTPQICASYYPEPQEDDFGLQAVPFSEIGSVAVPLAVYLSALALFLLAASYIGAEFTSGAIANWLSFVPRRGLVFAAKLIIIVIFAVMVSAAATALSLGAAALLSHLHGGAINSLTPLLTTAARGLLVAVILAVVGYCAGLVTRHTAAALGLLLGYVFIWFVRNGILRDVGWAQRLTPWSAEGNIAAVLGNGHRYQIPQERLTERGLETEFLERTVSLNSGLFYWAVVLIVVVAGSALIFRRRDVS